MERNILCTGNRYCISTNKYNAISDSFMKLAKKYMKQATNVKSFLFRASIPPLLFTANFSKVKRKNLSRENSNLALKCFNTCGTSQVCTAGSTKVLCLHGKLTLLRESEYSTYYLHECYQHNYEMLT